MIASTWTGNRKSLSTQEQRNAQPNWSVTHPQGRFDRRETGLPRSMRHGEPLPLAATPGLMHCWCCCSLGRSARREESRESVRVVLMSFARQLHSAGHQPHLQFLGAKRASEAAAVSSLRALSCCANPARWQTPRGGKPLAAN